MWTLEKIKDCFDKFLKENGRIPTAPEIDKIDCSPSSRTIQRSFGGLEKLRKEFGYSDLHFNKGHRRSTAVKEFNKRGRNIEIELEKELKNIFHEVFVHTEKIFDDSKVRVDFYVYNKTNNFGVDVFYTDTMVNLLKILV